MYGGETILPTSLCMPRYMVNARINSSKVSLESGVRWLEL